MDAVTPNRMDPGFAALACGLLGLAALTQQCAAQGNGTQSLVVPNVDASRPGPTYRDDPFTIGSRYLLEVYDASQFPSLSQGGVITGISFREDEGRGGFDAKYSAVKIQLATFPQAVNTLPASYNASNYKDSTVVYSHQDVRLTGQGSTSLSVPPPFELRFAFDKPFVYNPAAGNLLVYIDLGLLVAGGVEVDVDDSRPNFSHPAGYSVAGPGPLPPFGGVPGPEVLVAQFEYSAVPEPRTGAILVLGALFWVGRRESRKQSA